MIETTTTHHRRVSINNKRPPLIRSSSPSCYIQSDTTTTTTTTTKPKKSVRFCDNASLENIRLFLKTQMPKACRSDPPTVLTYTCQLKTINWSPSSSSSSSAATSVVRLEEIHLVNNQLVGTCQVANLAFEKRVLIRYSLDDWYTCQQVEATYQTSVNNWDRFCFKVDILNDITKHRQYQHNTIYLAIKYTVAGREFWDNNDNKNYQLDILTQVHQDDFCSSSSSSSSSEEDNDDNTFEVEEDSLMEPSLSCRRPTKTSMPTTKFIVPIASAAPLSPTTPADDSSNSLWIPPTSRFYYNCSTAAAAAGGGVVPTTTITTTTTDYFGRHVNNNKNNNNNKEQQKDFHQMINKHCFYNSNNNNPSLYHYSSSSSTSSPIRTSPTLPTSSKAIHS